MAELFPPGSSTPIMTVPHRFHDEVERDVIISPHPFLVETRKVKMPAGATVAEMVAAAGIAPVHLDFISVFVDDYQVPREQWRFIRPKAGRYVYVRVTPQKGSNDILRSVLMVVVVVAAAYFAPMLAAGLVSQGIIGAGAQALAGSLIGAGLSLLGSLAVSALFPPPPQTPTLPSQRTLLSGVRNQFQPYAFMPRHFGMRRTYPLQAAHPYTEAQGTNRFLRVLLTPGYGPVEISDVKIGDTAIENYNAINMQVRFGQHAGHDAFGTRRLNELVKLTTADTYSTSNITETTVQGRKRFTSTASTPTVDFPLTTAIDGSTTRWVRARIRRIGPSGTTWRGYVGWKTAGHGYSVASYGAFVADVVADDGEWIVLAWDMQNAVNGAADWNSSMITGIRVATYQNIGTVFEVDWVKVGSLRAPDGEQTLFTNSVSEETFAITFPDAGPTAWEVRTTDEDTTEISVDVTFPAGLAHFTDSGATEEITILMDVQYRAVGAGSWTSVTWDGNDAEDGTQTDGKLTCKASSRTAITFGGRWICPSAGQYEVQIRRATTAFSPSREYAQDAQWTALRSIKAANPVALPGTAQIALRMKATDQLSGLPDTINCVVKAYLPQNYGQGWIWEETDSPAWAFCDVMRRRGTDRLVADSRIDLARIRDWAKEAAKTAVNANENRWTFNGTFEGGSVWQVAKVIAGHSRANFALRDGKYSAVYDIEQTVPVQHITPRNSFGYSGARAYIDQPHAIKVQFVNAQTGWQEDEVIVYADGYDETNASKFETLFMPGCTSGTEAWRAGRYLLAVGRLRPDEHKVSMDIEYLRCSQGDYVLFSHDVVSIGISAARITDLSTSGSNITGITIDQTVPREAGVSYGLRVRKSDGTSVLLPLAVTTGAATETNALTLAAATPTSGGPEVGDLVIYGELGTETAPMLVKKIDPGPQLTARLTLVDAQEGVWEADKGDIPAFNTYITETTPVNQIAPALPVITLASDEKVLEVLADGSMQERIAVTLGTLRATKTPAVTWEVQFRQSGSVNWISLNPVSVSIKTVFCTPVRQTIAYDVRARTISQYGIASEWVTILSYPVIGMTTPPANVTGFSAAAVADGVTLSWDANPELDIVGYRLMRGTNWETATQIQNKYQGTSIFVRLTTKDQQTFLIKAMDKVGLMSDAPASITTGVTKPDDVPEFTAYLQGNDLVRFNWKEVYGTGISYEIREGASWAEGRLVTRVPGSTVTQQYPVRTSGTTTFWIKAVSEVGLYSTNGQDCFITLQAAPSVNIIVDDDIPASSWSGTLSNLTLNGSGSGSYLTVNKDVFGLTYGAADFYRNISLSATYKSRVWLDILLTLTSGALDWTSQVRWEDADELTWVGEIADELSAKVRPYLSIQDATWAPNNHIETFSFNGTTTGTAGTTPSSALNVAYGPMGGVQGLEAKPSTVQYSTLSIAAPWTCLIDFLFTWDSPNFALMVMGVPADPSTDGLSPAQSYGSFGVVDIGWSSGTLQLFYNAPTAEFWLVHNGGSSTIKIAADVQAGDRLTLGVAQATGKRTFYLYNARTGVISSAEDTAASSPGTITTLRTLAVGYEHAPGRLANIEFRSIAMSLSNFTAQAPFRAPVGYQPFKELVPADYKFQNAILRISTEVQDRSLDVQLFGAVLHVDVPDLVQSATETLSGTAISVTFAKPYTTVPKVVATQVSGGTFGIARITAVTTTGFTLDLRSAAAPGTSVSGTVSWTATGY